MGTKRIKQIRKNIGGNPTSFYSVPIGIDGYLADMISGFNLQEQFKIGGNHYVKIFDSGDDTIIYQYYLRDKTKIGNSKFVDFLKNGNTNKIAYSVYIKIGKGNSFSTDSNFIDNENDQNFLIDNTTDENLLVHRQTLESSGDVIYIALYKNYLTFPGADPLIPRGNATLLYEKWINIYSDGSDFDIDEQISENNEINESVYPY